MIRLAIAKLELGGRSKYCVYVFVTYIASGLWTELR